MLIKGPGTNLQEVKEPLTSVHTQNEFDAVYCLGSDRPKAQARKATSRAPGRK